MGTEKEAAKKLPEEAAEAYAAWDEVDDCGSPELCRDCDLPNPCKSILALADEIADVIQASCNLAARYNLDLQAAMERCEQKNRSRGRYQMEEKHVESCADAPVGVDNLPKSPEDMSAEELIKAICLTNGYGYITDEHGFLRGGSCKETLGDDWCDSYYTCRDCRNRLLGLLKAAYEREIENAHKCDDLQQAFANEIKHTAELEREVADKDTEIEHVKKRCVILSESYDKTMVERAQLERQVADLAHECDGLRNRLAELNEAGITSLHRLLREAMGEAKNVTHNARVYIGNQQGSKDERRGDCGTDSGCDSCDCGAERVGERVLSEEPPAQEMSEREKVLERLRGYEVYMTEPPSKNANRLFACITGNKDAEIACGNDIEDVRDKLIELIGEGGAE